ncbi:hypothetical protein [Nocardia alni]|uniref:hypothetical protein n=1 Tax=Nocardia alni TaxID=2815723 RepID=UPI001C23C6BB|nr:hypothetical protein [Nocardia alni]
MAEFGSSTSDHSADARLAEQAQSHRELLRGPVEEYRWRLERQARYLGPTQRPPLLAVARERIADLMIDPVRHRELDMDAYLAVREGWPVRFDARRQMFVAERGRHEVWIGPHSAERRLGIIARLAAEGAELEQILLVASVVIAHPPGPGAAVVPPVRARRAESGPSAMPRASGSAG